MSWNFFVDGINSTDKSCLEGEMELIGKRGSNNTTNIGMFLSASKYVSIKFVDQCLHILNNKEILNGLKVSKKFKRWNHYSNINNIYKMFKVNLMLIT